MREEDRLTPDRVRVKFGVSGVCGEREVGSHGSSKGVRNHTTVPGKLSARRRAPQSPPRAFTRAARQHMPVPMPPTASRLKFTGRLYRALSSMGEKRCALASCTLNSIILRPPTTTHRTVTVMPLSLPSARDRSLYLHALPITQSRLSWGELIKIGRDVKM
jgi:hypothetical protein